MSAGAGRWIAFGTPPGVPWPFHLANIILHGLVTMLVGVLAWIMITYARIDARVSYE